jgi:hypothetical protein
MKLGAMTGLGCTQGIEPELWKKREQKESMRRVENKKRSGRTKSAAALPDRSANAEGWSKRTGRTVARSVAAQTTNSRNASSASEGTKTT